MLARPEPRAGGPGVGFPLQLIIYIKVQKFFQFMGILTKSQAPRRIGLSEYKNDPIIPKLIIKSLDTILK